MIITGAMAARARGMNPRITSSMSSLLPLFLAYPHLAMTRQGVMDSLWLG